MICPHCHKDTEVPDWPRSKEFTSELWFDAFWQLYPRKVAKASALKAWKKACTSEAIKDEIMAGLHRSRTDWQLRQVPRDYEPHAATYLNGRRWEDEASLGSLSKNDKPRVIACPDCGDSGIVAVKGPGGMFARCSCARGQLPGLVIPCADDLAATQASDD